MKTCCICQRVIENEDAPVLTMGAVGTPKLLCDGCAELLDTATLGREYEEIEAAMDELGKRMADGNPDRTTFGNMSVLMAHAAGRAKAIKLGAYDFEQDNVSAEDEAPDEIPEELQETEEDRELDRKDEEKLKKFDKVYNWMLIGAGVALVGMIVWKVVERFFLN